MRARLHPVQLTFPTQSTGSAGKKKKNLPGISRARMHFRCMRLRAELGIGPVILHLHADSSSLPVGARPLCSSALHVAGRGARR